MRVSRGGFLSRAECEEFCGTRAELFVFKSRAEPAELAEGVLWNSRRGIIWRGVEGAEEFCRTRAEVFYLALSARSFVELSRSCLFLNLAQSPPSSRRECLSLKKVDS